MLEADGIAVVGEAANGAEAVARALELAPDVVVIALNMPDASGMEAVARIVEERPEMGVVVLSVSADDGDVLEALAAGACGYLLKDTHGEELVGAISQVAGGHAVLPRETVRALMERARVDDPAAEEEAADQGPALTAREMDVLRLIVRGADNAAIGLELSISRHTVKQYVTNIFEKLGVQSRVEAAVYAVRNGLA